MLLAAKCLRPASVACGQRDPNTESATVLASFPLRVIEWLESGGTCVEVRLCARETQRESAQRKREELNLEELNLEEFKLELSPIVRPMPRLRARVQNAGQRCCLPQWGVRVFKQEARRTERRGPGGDCAKERDERTT